MSEPVTTLELRVPKSLRAVIGVIMLTGFLLFFVLLAIYDLINSITYISPILWLALVAVMLFGFCKEWGPRQVLNNVVGAFAPQEFIWTTQRDDNRKEIHFGYQSFGHRFSYWKIPVDKITQVYWNTGQGTHLAGRDMNDWSVVVWYEHNDPAKTLKREKYSKNPDQDLYLIGPPGKKEDTAAFGHSLLDLLRNSGVSLIPSEDECHFQRGPVYQEKPSHD